MMFVFILSGLIFANTAFAGAPEKIAVLSFNINSEKNLDYIKKGISTMLYSRLTNPEKVIVVPPGKMASLEAGLKGLRNNELIHEAAQNRIQICALRHHHQPCRCFQH